MSSTVVVVYRTRQVKVKCNPGTLIKEIKGNACSVLNLDVEKYDLKHGKDILASSSPFRLCNIVSNAKIELVPAKARPNKGIVKVRLQVVDLPPEFSSKLLADFPSTSTIWNILKAFEKTSGINFTERKVKKVLKEYYEVPTVQLFNKVLTKLADLDESLQELGIEDGTTSMRIRFEKSELSFDKAIEFVKRFRTNEQSAKAAEAADAKKDAAKVEHAPSTTTAQPEVKANEGIANTTNGPKDSHSEPSRSSNGSNSNPAPLEEQKETEMTPETRQINVYTPATKTRIVGDSGPEEEMNLQQFSRYQNQLKAMSEPHPVLMTKTMREQADLDKRSKLAQCTVRVRLPDQSHIEANFKGTETTDALYDFVKSMLRRPDEPFVLFVTPPRKELAPGLRLNIDCKFTSRELVFFEWRRPQKPIGPILKDEVLGTAKPISETLVDSNSSDSQPESSRAQKLVDKSKKFSSKPKWMKLSKK